MKKLLFFGACLVALTSQPVIAQTVGPQVVVVRVNDTPGLGGYLVIIRGTGKNEEVDFQPGMTPKHLLASGETMQGVFARLYQEGYSLKSTFGGGQGYTATLVFVKEK